MTLRKFKVSRWAMSREYIVSEFYTSNLFTAVLTANDAIDRDLEEHDAIKRNISVREYSLYEHKMTILVTYEIKSDGVEHIMFYYMVETTGDD